MDTPANTLRFSGQVAMSGDRGTAGPDDGFRCGSAVSSMQELDELVAQRDSVDEAYKW